MRTTLTFNAEITEMIKKLRCSGIFGDTLEEVVGNLVCRALSDPPVLKYILLEKGK